LQRQEVSQGIHGQAIRDERGPLRLHEQQLGGDRRREQRRERPERRGLAPLTRAKEETWTGQFEGAKQGAERAGMRAFGFERGAAVRAGCTRLEKRLNLVLQQALLESVQELFGLPECQAQMLDALGVLLQGDEVSDGFFLAIIAAYDELEFDAHGRAPPGLRGG